MLTFCVQLTAVNSVVFAVEARDADGDVISYVIDPSSVRPVHKLLSTCPTCRHELTCGPLPTARRPALQDRSEQGDSEQTSGLRDQASAAGGHLGSGKQLVAANHS